MESLSFHSVLTVFITENKSLRRTFEANALKYLTHSELTVWKILHFIIHKTQKNHD